MSTPGLGGMNPAPVNAPQGALPAAGVQPGQSTAVVIANKVIVFGPNDGLFVYSGTPKLGNPPIFWATSATKDPYGNTVTPTAGIAGTGEFRAPNTIINAAGTFTYAGTPAANKMILSDANTGGTDDFGNQYLSGLTGYQAVGLGSSWVACQFSGSGRSAWATPGPSQTGWIPEGTELFGGGWTLDLSGVGPGLDGVTFRLTTGLAALISGSLETWHPITLDAGWTASSPLPQYRLLPDGNVQLTGVATHASFTAPTNVNAGAPLPAAYQPASTKDVKPNNAIDAQAAVAVTTAGVIAARANATFPATQVNLECIYSLQ